MWLQNLGNLIKCAREAKGMTQSEVAENANIDEKHYGRIERNECWNPTILTFIQICYALDVMPDDLLKELLNEKNV